MDCFCEWLHANGWRLGQKEWDCWAEDGEGGRSCSWWSLSAWYQRMDGEAGNPDALLDAPAPKITPCVRMLDLCLTLSLRMSFHCKLPCTLEEWDLLWWCSEVLLIHSLFNPLDHLLRLGLVELLEEALFTHLSCNSCEYLSICLFVCLPNNEILPWGRVHGGWYADLKRQPSLWRCQDYAIDHMVTSRSWGVWSSLCSLEEGAGFLSLEKKRKKKTVEITVNKQGSKP